VSQFSLDAYVSLFNISLEKSGRSDDLTERIKNLNDYHTCDHDHPITV